MRTGCLLAYFSSGFRVPLVHDMRSGMTSTRQRRQSTARRASTFQAPIPPDSHGEPVFPHIDVSSVGVASSRASIERNSDPNSVFIVTGANRGIGLQFAKKLAETTDATIIACCRTRSNELDIVAAKHDKMKVMPLDLEDQSSIDSLISDISTSYQRVDALYNVAGILGDGKTTPGPERAIEKIDRDWLEKTFAVNVIGPTMLAKGLSPLMRSKGRTKVKVATLEGPVDVELPKKRTTTVIVNLSARVGSICDNQLGGWISYRMSKSALNQATRTMAIELKRQGTHAIALHPGTTDTGLSKPFQRNVKEGRLFPVEFTVESLIKVVNSMEEENSGGFYDWAGKALPF